ncbi:MAG: hypothetical protein HY508_02050 [Acidobacteria bacterium]|nr:hypothetical protein [Acidobacteriota bacterium]
MLDHRPIRITLARLVLGLTAAACMAGVRVHAAELPSAHPPRITYTKILKGGVPEYLSISVDQRGAAVYEGRKLDDPSLPRQLQLTEATTRRIFELAAALNNFDAEELESYKKVANLGHKTLIYDDGRQKHKVEFNYTQRSVARDLVDILEGISNVAQYIATLEHSIQFDHLSLPTQLRQIQVDLERRALADPELMAPTLEKIVRNPRFLHLAQSRAQTILDRLQVGH